MYFLILTNCEFTSCTGSNRAKVPSSIALHLIIRVLKVSECSTCPLLRIHWYLLLALHGRKIHAHEAHAHEVYAHKVHAMKYMLLRRLPMRYTPMRWTSLRHTLTR